MMFPPGAHMQHPNGLRFTAFDAAGALLDQRTFFSIGGGFITEDGAIGRKPPLNPMRRSRPDSISVSQRGGAA